MSEVKKEYSELEDEYLDCLIKLAYDLDDLEKGQQAMEEAKDGTSAPDELSVRRAWQKAQEKMDLLEREEKRRKRRNAVRRTVPQVLKVAACILLVISIGVPAVIAGSKEIRSRVIEMLVNIDRENNAVRVDFDENPGASFAVPAEWNGDYFMSWLPEGLEQIWIDADSGQVEYADAADGTPGRRFVSFSEVKESGWSVSLWEEKEPAETEINGRRALIVEDSKDHTVVIQWQNDEKMFNLITGSLTTEETRKIAESVRKIIE